MKPDRARALLGSILTLWRVFPKWKKPPPRETIREDYARFEVTRQAPRLARHLVVR